MEGSEGAIAISTRLGSASKPEALVMLIQEVEPLLFFASPPIVVKQKPNSLIRVRDNVATYLSPFGANQMLVAEIPDAACNRPKSFSA